MNLIKRKCCTTCAGVVLALCAVPLWLVRSPECEAQTYTPNYIYTIAGGGSIAADPLAAMLPGPTAAVKDSAGNIYIAAPASAYVLKLTTSGTLSVLTGKGFGGFGGDGKGYNLATVSEVSGLTFDNKGNLYLVDSAGSRIRAINLGKTAITIGTVSVNPNTIATVAGDGTKCDHSQACGDGAVATAANLNLPESVAFDAAGNIYIADSVDNRIRVVNVGSSAITIAGVNIGPGDINTIAGQSASCSSPQGGCGDGGPANQAFLNDPYGVAVDRNGNIYIADTYDQRIRLIAAGQNNISTIAGNGLACTNPLGGCGNGRVGTNAEVHLPQGVFTDATGDLYIADTQDHMIRFIAAGQNTITLAAGDGTQGFAGDGGTPTAAQLDLPGGIFVDASGNMLISDTGNQRVRQVTAGATPTISTIAGGGNGGDGGLPTKATLASPWAVAEDAAGSLYIVDQANNRIRKITNPGQANAVITTVAGNGNVGYSGDGGPAVDATLNAPSSIAFDSNGNLYIADTNNLVIREVNMSTGVIYTVLGSGRSCYPTTGKCGDAQGPLQANFALPLVITLDAANNVYVSDWQGYRIREWNVSTNSVSTVAGTGISGARGNGGVATSAYLNHPAGLVLDTAANSYIADQYNNVIRWVSGGIINLFALNGNANLKGDGGPATSGSMWNPLMLAIDPASDIFISGGNDNTVQRISAATGVYSTVAGTPTNAIQGGYAGDGGPALNAHMANLGALVDGNNNLYIADGGNNRVRYVPLAAAVSLAPATVRTGQWALGRAGNPATLTVSAAGGVDLNISAISFGGTNAGDFSQTNNCGTLPASVSPQATCTIQITLTPSSYGPESATLKITDNAAGSPQSVTLTGSGPNFTIAESPGTITVSAGSKGAGTVTLGPQARFNQSIALSCSGLPANTTCSFNPNPVPMPGGSAQKVALTVTTSSGTPTGTYTVTVSGKFGTLTNSTTFTLIVQ
ncbi:MAG TPA: choice-of-anchor D domain-containing protein [Candidatus Aquilonibacter sp.]|nr:choice-of-anchor D domain-containing protein [Candidatus Aquilonibacter sp.]